MLSTALFSEAMWDGGLLQLTVTSSLASLWSSQGGQGPSASGLISLGSYTIEGKNRFRVIQSAQMSFQL